MRMFYALAAIPAVVVLAAAMVVACRKDDVRKGPAALVVGTDVGRARSALMSIVPIGTPEDDAFSKLKAQGLACAVSMPPLSNLTWRIIECSITPSRSGALLVVDVAGRNGVVADIGVEDLACLSRADAVDPDPEPGGCDLSGKRLLDMEARNRIAENALLARLLNVAEPSEIR